MNGLPYYIGRKIKLAKMRENIDRISYDGKTTKRATRFFRLYENLEKNYSEQTKIMARQLFSI